MKGIMTPAYEAWKTTIEELLESQTNNSPPYTTSTNREKACEIYPDIKTNPAVK